MQQACQEAAPPSAAISACNGLQFFGLTPHQHPMGAQPGPLVGGAAANARATARDDDHLARKQARRENGLLLIWPCKV